MRAEIISVGTELLLGEITDTNASFLAGELPDLGIDLYWISQVGDNLNRLVSVLNCAWQRSDLILLTGGLGPTEDDLTRDAIAELVGEGPRPVPELENELSSFFARLGREMSANNLKQATVIPSGKAIPNRHGTAPGWWVEKEGHIIIAMPGPPREMQPMWQEEVRPRLSLKAGGGMVIISRTLKLFGVPEGDVAQLVAPLVSSANPTLGIYAKADGIHLRLAAKAPSQPEAKEMIAQGESRIRQILGNSIWGTDDDTLETVVGNMLSERRLSLAVMESYTGGLLAAAITDAPAAAVYFKGGLITGSAEAQIVDGVEAKIISDHGADSAEAAGAMAAAARLRLSADIGLATTGRYEIDDGGGKPVSRFHIGIDSAKQSQVITSGYPGDRVRVKRWAVSATLFALRKALITYGNQ
jgi:nicotinamide-nucleotide amidase